VGITENHEENTTVILGIIQHRDTTTEIQEGLMIIVVVMDSEISREDQVIITMSEEATIIVSIILTGEVVITSDLLITESVLLKITMDGLRFKVPTTVVVSIM
jgi:hypothetical protein